MGTGARGRGGAGADGGAGQAAADGTRDVAWQRLRASAPVPRDEAGDAPESDDPAALARVRARLDEKIAARPDPGTDASPDGAVVDLGRARARRRGRTTGLVAACTAGALLVGGAGFAAGSAAGGTGGAPLAADAPVQPGSSLGTTGTQDDDASTWAGPESPGRAVFRAGDLAEGADTAAAWGLDSTRVATSEGVAHLAEALGVSGEPQYADGEWAVGAESESLTVEVDGSATASFSDATTSPWFCDEQDDGSAPPSSEGCGTDQPDAPQGDEAEDVAREFLERAGVTDELPEAATLTMSLASDDATSTFVSVALALDGRQTDVSWWLAVTATGVQDFVGPLARVVPLGDVAVVSPQDAVARLGDPRFGATVVHQPGADGPVVGLEDDERSATTQAVVPPAPTPGEPFAWPVDDVVVTGAELALVDLTDDAGTVSLVPAYHLSAADGRVWSVPAVVEDSLDTASR